MKEQRGRRKTDQPSVKKPESSRITSIFTRIHLRNILFAVSAILFSLTAVAVFELIDVYDDYAAMVDKQLEQRSLQRRAGIYAAPRRVSVEQQISWDELRERLLRAGYQEGEQADQFSSGSFVFDGDMVEVRTNEFARTENLPEVINIKFSKRVKGLGRVANIENAATGQEIENATLPPELITADGAAGMHPVGFASFDDFPPSLVKAVIAIEDRQFFSHRGVDVKAVFRAMLANWRHGEIREGGSTITQQLIKTSFLTPERTYQRKFAEALMAMAIERRLSKQEIFAVYGNRIYLGQSGMTAVYGFKQAARVFFGKDLPELSLAESALIAGLAQAPNRYSPYLHPDAATARRNTVLDAMAEMGEISSEEAEAAKSEKLVVVPPGKPDESAAQHFVDYLKRELASRNISERDEMSLRIQTTLDLDLQQAANIAVKNHLEKLDRAFSHHTKGAKTALPEAALIAIDPHTGEILAMVGGRDYTSSQLNRVTDARRQPGSVFKPIVYAAALAHGMAPTDTFDDAPQDFIFGIETYRPQNYGGRFSNRTVTLREGIVRSLNVVAVDAAMRVGLPNVANIAHKMGMPRPEPYPSMALGAFEATPFEIAQAYSTFANGGTRVTPFGVKTLIEGDVSGGENTASKAKVLGASAAYVITDTLAEVVDHGTATRIRGMGYRGPAAGKTGSSRDAWFAGYTPNILVVVWVGFDDHHDLVLTGGEAAVPIWTDFVSRALALRPDLNAEKFTRPTGVEEVEIDPENGMLANEYCPHRKLVRVNVWMVPPYCFKHHSDQSKSARQRKDSILAGNTRRRAVRRVKQVTDSEPADEMLLRPVVEEHDFLPDPPSLMIRQQVESPKQKVGEGQLPAAGPTPPPATGQKPEIKKEDSSRPGH